MAVTYSGRAQFLVIYIREAHPSEDWAIPVSREIGTIDEPKSALERREVAQTCVADLEISIPTVLDNMEDTIAQAYKAHPDRLYVVGKDGAIAYRSGPGPGGFKPDRMERALIAELEKNTPNSPVSTPR